MLFGDWFMWKKQKRGDLPWKWSFWRVSKLVLYAQSTGMVISGWFLEGCCWVFEDFFKESNFFPSGLLNTQPRTDVDLWTVLLWERNQANIAVYSMLLYILYVITPHVALLKVCIVFWKSVPPWCNCHGWLGIKNQLFVYPSVCLLKVKVQRNELAPLNCFLMCVRVHVWLWLFVNVCVCVCECVCVCGVCSCSWWHVCSDDLCSSQYQGWQRRPIQPLLCWSGHRQCLWNCV